MEHNLNFIFFTVENMCTISYPSKKEVVNSCETVCLEGTRISECQIC